MSPSIHACAVLVGADGVLIRGPSGAGKSRLALALLDQAATGGGFARLVADDRVCLENHHGRVIAIAPDATAGLIEQRGLGIRRVPHEREAVIRLVVDIVPPEELKRLPEPAETEVEINGTTLRRLAVPADVASALALIRAALGGDVAAGP